VKAVKGSVKRGLDLQIISCRFVLAPRFADVTGHPVVEVLAPARSIAATRPAESVIGSHFRARWPRADFSLCNRCTGVHRQPSCMAARLLILVTLSKGLGISAGRKASGATAGNTAFGINPHKKTASREARFCKAEGQGSTMSYPPEDKVHGMGPTTQVLSFQDCRF
jgi:hypothetical protein